MEYEAVAAWPVVPLVVNWGDILLPTGKVL